MTYWLPLELPLPGKEREVQHNICVNIVRLAKLARVVHPRNWQLPVRQPHGNWRTGKRRRGGKRHQAAPPPIQPNPLWWPDDPRRPFKRYQLKTDPGLAQLEERVYTSPTLKRTLPCIWV